MGTEFSEADMLRPVLRLFPKKRYLRFVEVPTGRKRIDLVCSPKNEGATVAVELKISDWRQALWQASIDLQVADKAYIAIWHEFAPRAERNSELLGEYGVGLISVRPRSATIVLESNDPVFRVARESKPDFYRLLLEQV